MFDSYSDGPAADPPEISIVVPLFNEQETLPVLYRRIGESLDGEALDYEMIFVNDGSRDATPILLDELAVNDPRIVVLHLSRNFGHQSAVSAGLDHARGRAVIVMDGDLQDPPEVLPEFIALWREGHEVVYAIRERRKEGVFKRAGYHLFYRLLRKVTPFEIPLDSGDFCLMDRQVVDAMKQMPERLRFVRGLRAFVGFRQVGVRYERAAREAGRPKYTIRALLKLAVDGLISFSAAPLTAITYMGSICLIASFIAAGWLGIHAWSNDMTPQGWAFAVVAVLFMGSIQLLSLGIVGEYVRRIFWEVKGRPAYIVRQSKPAVWAARFRVTQQPHGVSMGHNPSGLVHAPRDTAEAASSSTLVTVNPAA